jgi:hypothetical protein
VAAEDHGDLTGPGRERHPVDGGHVAAAHHQPVDLGELFRADAPRTVLAEVALGAASAVRQ